MHISLKPSTIFLKKLKKISLPGNTTNWQAESFPNFRAFRNTLSYDICLPLALSGILFIEFNLGGFPLKRLLVIGVSFVVLLGALLACGEASNNQGSTDGGNAGYLSPKSIANQHFKVGQVVKVGNKWELTVNGVKLSKGDALSKPEAGNTYVVTNVTVKNIGNREESLSSIAQFKIKAKDGTQGRLALLTSGVTPPPDGKLAAGDVVKGDLVYELPASQKNFTLSFQSDLISSGQTIWDLDA
jgi:hypothetical protein